MKTLLLACVVAFGVIGIWTALPAVAQEAPGEELDVNGGFEKTETFTKYEDQYRKWVKDGVELPDPFVKPAGWHPANFFDHKWNIETVTDESDLEEVYNTERHLLYVACTRARDRLLVTGVDPGSEFLDDISG